MPARSAFWQKQLLLLAHSNACSNFRNSSTRCSFYFPSTGKQRKTMDHGIVKYNCAQWWEWDAFSAWVVILHAFLISEIFFSKKNVIIHVTRNNSLQLKMHLKIKGHISVKFCICSILLATGLCPQGLEVSGAKYENLHLTYLILYMDN